MTTETTIAERATVPQILADLILLQQSHRLPDPESMRATYENGCAGLNLFERHHLDLWAKALGVTEIAEQQLDDGRWLHTSRSYIVRRGWSISLAAVTAVAITQPLEPEVVARLEAIAVGGVA